MPAQILPDLSIDENMLPEVGVETEETNTIFSEVSKEAPFPVVTTFGRFLRLLENEIKLGWHLSSLQTLSDVMLKTGESWTGL